MCRSHLEVYSCDCIKSSTFSRCAAYTPTSACSAFTTTFAFDRSPCALHTIMSETRIVQAQLEEHLAAVALRAISGAELGEGLLEETLERMERMEEECDELYEFVEEIERLVAEKEEAGRVERRREMGW